MAAHKSDLCVASHYKITSCEIWLGRKSDKCLTKAYPLLLAPPSVRFCVSLGRVKLRNVVRLVVWLKDGAPSVYWTRYEWINRFVERASSSWSFCYRAGVRNAQKCICYNCASLCITNPHVYFTWLIVTVS